MSSSPFPTWGGDGARAVRKRKRLSLIAQQAAEATFVATVVVAAEDAAKQGAAARERDAAARASRAATQARVGGRFSKASTSQCGGSGMTVRPAEQQLRLENRNVKAELAKMIKDRNAEKREEQTPAEIEKERDELRVKLAQKEKQHRILRRKFQALQFVHRKTAAELAVGNPPPPRPIGGDSAPTLLKMAAELNSFLETRFASPADIQKGLLEHYSRNRHLYSLILQSEITQNQFDEVCARNPAWCQTTQRDFVKEITAHYTLARCLTFQIICRVGHQEKYQDAINLLAKVFNTKTKKWDRVEIGYKGGPKESRLHIPLLKSKNEVSKFRKEIHAKNPVLQDEDGTAAWLQDLPAILEEDIVNERTRGYLESRKGLSEDELRVHFGGDAASYFRAVSTSKFAVKLIVDGQQVNHNPRSMRSLLQFEGKDSYETCKRYYSPFIPVIDQLQKEGIEVDNTHYKLILTLGGDYVWLAEIHGHSGHSHTSGCLFCYCPKSNYGAVVVKNGRRVPEGTRRRTTEEMHAGAHRPLKTGPNEKCPHWPQRFPDQATVDALPGPQNKNQHKDYATTHHGMRFGTLAPLLPIGILAVYLCILHTLLRLAATTFQRTIESNLNTQEKVDIINDFIKKLNLGCKKVVIRKRDGNSKKDTEAINFIGREALVILDERVYTRICESVIDEPDKRATCILVWASLAAFNRELRAPMLNPKDVAQRTAKSILVQNLAVGFVDAYTMAGFGDMCTLYMHLSMEHIPEQIRGLPLDLSVVSQQGLEHLLKMGKTDAHLFFNKRKRGDGQESGRNQQVLHKEQERKRMKAEIALPKGRTERRMDADQDILARNKVDRAEARGVLSRTDEMIRKRVEKA
ncbi:hypothetical protein KFL_004090010 [Klebsormidium nitens]|uniref:Uncharacterized protein n=1 Tax=Klebsormidium nitens TaxID=105231 RepID=A0A1Y1IBA7_KLENI|nr:hypothetical protein KFL_004090010 [Klebsormidium nitens]|eukprot:GAQ88200.1 hypothetical protein KFL_004090010 [Klebsormidium nitens]